MTDFLLDEKISECREVFDLFDKDKDGAITAKELGDVMRALGANPTQAELDEMTLEVVKDETSQRIEFKEFLQLFAKKMKDPDTEEDLLEAFRVFDHDNDGIISNEELKHVMVTLGEFMSEEEADEMVREADIDGDGLIDYIRFVKIMMTNKL